MILSGLSFVLSLPTVGKTKCFVHLIFYCTFQLNNGIPIDLQQLLKYFNGTANVSVFRIPLAAFGAG